jgi:hypothetical protein
MMSPATTLLQCWTTLRRFSGPVQDKKEEEEEEGSLMNFSFQ